MNTHRTIILTALAAASVLLLVSCASGPNLRAGQTAVMNMTPLDLKACYPRLDRDWGTETKVQGMGVAIRDAYPRLRECSNDFFFRSDESGGEVNVELKVQPDHEVAVSYETDIEDPVFRSCVERALDMIELPIAAGPAGQKAEFTYEVTTKGDDALRINASKAGTIVGTIRTNALNACACFEDYRNTVPEDLAFAFVLQPDSPYPKNVRPIGDVEDPELASCLAQHLQETKIRQFDSELKAKYRFKTENSRALSPDRLAADAAELHNRGNYQTALQLYQRALDIEPNHVGSMLGLAAVYLDTGHDGKALQIARKAIESGADENPSAYYRVARAHLGLGNVEAARDAAEESLNLDPESFHAWHVMGLIGLRQDKLAKAMRAVEKSQTLNPDYLPAYIAKARIYQAMNEPEQALETLKRAKRLDIIEPIAYSKMGNVYMELDKFELALDAYEIAQKRGLDSSYMYYNMAVCHQNLGNSGKAEKLACKAATKRPPLPEATEWCER